MARRISTKCALVDRWIRGGSGRVVVVVMLPLGWRVCVRTLGGTITLRLETCQSCFGTCFWLPVIGGQAYRIPPLTTAAWEEEKILFDEKTGSIGQIPILVKGPHALWKFC